jgi:alpha-L-rhamnosidase
MRISFRSFLVTVLGTTAVAAFALPLINLPALAEPSRAATSIDHLRCENMKNPLGLDVSQPLLSWQMSTSRRGARQTAYEILVASRAELLEQGRSDVWDSGKVSSDESVGIPYHGPALQSGQRYYWQVRVWDEVGKSSKPSDISWWEMGLLSPSDWKARWIADDSESDRADRNSGLKWIWTAGEDALTDAKGGPHQFRLDFSLDQKPIQATLLITAEDQVTAWVNGEPVLKIPGTEAERRFHPWGTFITLDVTHQMKQGKNLLAAQASIDNGGHGASAGLIALLRVRMPDGKVVRFVSGPDWKSTLGAAGAWFAPAFNDDSWQPAVAAAKIGQEPFGTPWPPAPASYLRRDFTIRKQILSARVYATALGSYQLHLNGQRVGDQILAPGWTDYRSRLIYQTYDVTRMLHQGQDTLGALLGDGWYASGLTWSQMRFSYGPPPLQLLAQLDIQYTDGTQEVLGTDGSWKAAESPVLSSDIYNGEDYDAEREMPSWDQPGFSGATWHAVSIEPGPMAKLEAQDFPPIRQEMILHAKTVTRQSPGVYIFDLGQNMVGWERLQVQGPRGTKIKMRFGEVLDAQGHFYDANMRTAKETDTYTLNGDGQEVFEPHFTYHGFRYIEVTGYPGTPPKDAVEGVVFHTDALVTMQFHTENPMVNQLWSNILWGQRGNFMSVPTDCPQRDERLGWMGDAEVFWRTASYNMNLAAFSRKFTEDIRIAQSPDGPYWDISPRVGDAVSGGNPGWADAGVVIPWTAYLQYGDTSILQENWDAMTKWLNYLEQHNPTHVRHIASTYGDWLAIGSQTPNDLIATAYWAYDAALMAQMADALHKTEEAAKYRQLFGEIKDAFDQAFVHPDGTVGSGSQTSYVLALHMNLLPEALRATAADKLAADIQAHQGHLTTGFLGTPYIMLELSKSGHSDIAYELLFQKTFPSWGYMIEHGATTMWERWNGNQMLGDPGMNSFNHYAYGAVGEWLYRYMAGIDTDFTSPGFHRILMHPQFDAALGAANASFDSPYGTIASAWKDDGHTVSWNVTIPANTTALLYFPLNSGKSIHADGKSIAHDRGIQRHKGASGDPIYEAVSGSYHFTMTLQTH